MTQADSSTFSRTSKPRLRPFSPAVRPQAAPWLFWSEPCSKTSCPIGGENCKFHPPARFRLGQLQAGRRKVDFSHLSLHLPFPLGGLSAAAPGISALGAADYRVRFCPPPPRLVGGSCGFSGSSPISGPLIPALHMCASWAWPCRMSGSHRSSAHPQHLLPAP